MAAIIGCDLCGSEPAVLMQTSLTKGDVVSVGGACLTTFFAATLTAILSDAPPEVLNDLAPALTPLVAIIGPSQADMEDGIPPAFPDEPETELYAGPREDGGIPAGFHGLSPGNDDDEQGLAHDGSELPGIISADEMLHETGGQE